MTRKTIASQATLGELNWAGLTYRLESIYFMQRFVLRAPAQTVLGDVHRHKMATVDREELAIAADLLEDKGLSESAKMLRWLLVPGDPADATRNFHQTRKDRENSWAEFRQRGEL